MGHIALKRASNGYTVCVTDPAIVKANDSPNSRWRDPDREYVFDGDAALKAALRFIEAIADKALPKDDAPKDSFIDAFDAALEGDSDDGSKDGK